ncbi:MAG: hypothetical protein ABS75_26005 [Pelagibacterium sp. SCN 63-23]|nr:MAG: hypothetical protein ABS75_26005 [Pelagibacterium sp. SCN 63-23]
MFEPNATPLLVRTHLADRPNTHALFTGQITSPLVTLDICGPASVSKGFKPLVRQNAFEASELSVMTFLQAKAYNKPLVLLPATVLGRFQHVFLAVRADSDISDPAQLAGRRIGIRSYTVTTVTWARAILQAQFGVDIDAITWVAHEDGHLAEWRDPANVDRIDLNGRTLDDLLIAGDVDAVVLAKPNTNPAIRTLFADPAQASRNWYTQFGTLQLNHMFVVGTELSARRPDVVQAIYGMLKRAKAAAPKLELGLDALPFGVETNRRNLEVAIDMAWAQRLLPRRLVVDELFDATAIGLD